jgi:ABC-type lipoprotein release transport system permease subunit
MDFSSLTPGVLAAMIAGGLLALAAVVGLLALIITTGLDVLAAPKALLIQLAARSITSHKVKSIIVGGLLAGGTFLLVLGITFIINTQRQMEETITGGLVGHLQVYSKDAVDQIAFFGFAASGSQDLSVIQDFGKVKRELEKIPNVDAVVPMGRDVASAVGGNEFDDQLGELRKAVEAGDKPKIKGLVARLRHMVDLLETDLHNRGEISRDSEEIAGQLAIVKQVQDPAFWADFDDLGPLHCISTTSPQRPCAPQNPIARLDFLDTKVAQLQPDEAVFFMPYIGTDLDTFKKDFKRFQIDTDNGSRMIPSGQRGFLFNRTFYEEQGKNPVAHELDEIQKTMREDQTTIADSAEIRERIRKIVKIYRRITYQLTAEDAAALEASVTKLLTAEVPQQEAELAKGGANAWFKSIYLKLYGESLPTKVSLEAAQEALKASGQDRLNTLLGAYLNVDDVTFAERYKFFYDNIAPHIRLYKVNIGDTLTLRAFTKSGYTRALNLQVFGTFRFKGIDGSPVAARYNFMDIASFRDLYGLMTPERKRELEAIQKEVGVKDVSRENAEDQLFGADSTAAAETRETTHFADPERDDVVKARRSAASSEVKPLTQEEIDNGVVINASIRLKDPSRAALAKTMADIDEVSKKQSLNIQVIDWTTASGIVGQLVFVLTVALLLIIGIIFIVTLVIINNSMVMATMDRVTEIGMMRAIGAQRRFVRAMYMLETTVLAVVAVVAGSAVAAGLIAVLGRVGLRAPADLVVIMFGGRWLYPTVEPLSFGIALVIIGIVSLVATFYPALLATRIAPIVAMQRRE